MKKSKKRRKKSIREKEKRKRIYPDYKNYIAEGFYYKMGYIKHKKGDENATTKNM